MSNYKNLKTLVQSISNNIEALENGKLSVYDLESLLDDARSIHERIAILHYLAIDKEVKVGEKEKAGIQFNFEKPAEYIHPNQTNLIDAIETEYHNEAVKKSIGTQKPLFDFEEEEVVAEEKKEPIEEKLPSEKTEKAVEKEVKFEKPLLEKPKVEEIIKKVASSYKQPAKEESSSNTSLNDKFSEQAEQPTLADKLRQQPIEDLNKAIGLNQKFLFMNDLFEGENDKYKEAINTINNFSSYMEADEYISNSLVLQYNWDMSSPSAQKFVELVKRRFL